MRHGVRFRMPASAFRMNLAEQEGEVATISGVRSLRRTAGMSLPGQAVPGVIAERVSRAAGALFCFLPAGATGLFMKVYRGAPGSASHY